MGGGALLKDFTRSKGSNASARVCEGKKCWQNEGRVGLSR